MTTFGDNDDKAKFPALESDSRDRTRITFNFDPFDQEVGSPISVRKGA